MSIRVRILQLLSSNEDLSGKQIRMLLDLDGIRNDEHVAEILGRMELLGLVNGRYIELGDITRNLMVGNKIYSITPDGRDELKRESWRNVE